MNPGEVRQVTHGQCSDLFVIETGMFDVTGYGCVYVLDAERPAIIETGTGANVDRILDGLDSIGLTPAAIELIVVTHVHLDHAGGAGYLAEVCENATVVVSERGAPHLVDPSRLVAGTKAAVGEQWRHYEPPKPIPDSRISAIGSEETVDLGDRELIAYAAPGHARHQLVYVIPSLAAVVTGDAAGLWNEETRSVYPTTPPPEFDLDRAIADVERIADLGATTLLYTHFGPASATDGILEQYVDTLVEWVELIERTQNATENEAATIRRLVEQTPFVDLWGEEKGQAEARLNVRGVLTYLDRVSE